MNSIVNWNPLRELESMQDRILKAMHLGSSHAAENHASVAPVPWTPVMDISEDEQAYVVHAEIPGVQKEDVQVTLENGVLNIRGERRFEKEDKGRTYHRVERCYGSFSRSLAMPDDVDADRVKAEFKDGLLKVHLAKSEAKKPRQIEVLVN